MSLYFDETYYLQAKLALLKAEPTSAALWQNKTTNDVKDAIYNANMTPEQHYAVFGHAENLNPNAYFNESEYLEAKLASLKEHADTAAEWAGKDVADLASLLTDVGLTPASHYERFGAYETRGDGSLLNPSNAFDANAYFAAKLEQLVQSGGTLNGKPVSQVTVAEVVAMTREAGISVVTHYMVFGHAEAGAQKVPLVQTVPVSQRVQNDPQRDLVGENVPANYNPASPAPENAVAKPVSKPADMGAKAPTDISPTVTPPSAPVKVPGDAGYTSPPTNIEDTNDMPVVTVPPTSAGGTPQFGFVRGDGTVVKPGADGKPGSEVVGKVDGSGVVTPISPDPAPGTPETPEAPAPGGTDPGQPASGITATYSAGNNVLTVTGPIATAGSTVSVESTGKVGIIGGMAVADTVVFAPNGEIDARAVSGGSGQVLTINTVAFGGAHTVTGSASLATVATLGAAVTGFTGGGKSDYITVTGSANAEQSLEFAGGGGVDTLAFSGAAKSMTVSLSGIELLDLTNVDSQHLTLASVDVDLSTIRLGGGDKVILSAAQASILSSAHTALVSAMNTATVAVIVGDHERGGVNLSSLDCTGYAGGVTVIGSVKAETISLSTAADTVVVNFNSSSKVTTSSVNAYDTITGFTVGKDMLQFVDSNASVNLSLATGTFGSDTSAIAVSNGVVTNFGSDIGNSVTEKAAALLASGGLGAGGVAGFAVGNDFYVVMGDGIDGAAGGDVLVKLAGVSSADVHSLSISADGGIAFA